MIKNIGYVGANKLVHASGFTDCRFNAIFKYGISYLQHRIVDNLRMTLDILKWNVSNDIFVYTLHNNIMPHVTHPDLLKDFQWRWYDDEEVMQVVNEIAAYVDTHNIRLIIKPKFFNALSSTDPSLVHKTLAELEFETMLLNKLHGSDIVIQVGAVPKNRDLAIERFISVYRQLPKSLLKYLRLENDDNAFSASDCLLIFDETGIPVVIDIHSDRCKKGEYGLSVSLINAQKTWGDITPIVTVASGDRFVHDKRKADRLHEKEFELIDDLGKVADFDLIISSISGELDVLAAKDTELE